MTGGDEGSMLPLRTPHGDGQARIRLFAGHPLGEPAVAGSPFVMNSRAEKEQAFQGFRSGEFGQIPRATRLQTGRRRLSPRSRTSSRYGCAPFLERRF
ncbi:pirin-like C-terminal cupin domain-containing protein [Streptomyces sp. NPDC051001]|uniref:pirin-like C-terminal cupin domain-containing protein n=1 Tax=Streptomyces sp. NPDC051001 TaxID=3155795 RepID=UPI003433F4B6